MKKLFVYLLAAGMTLCFSNAFAAPSAKATAQLGDLSVIGVSSEEDPLSEDPSSIDSAGTDGWQQIFEQVIKTPTGKDLFIDVSLECGLTTNTKVMSRALAKALAEAEAIVEVRVLVDDVAVPVNGLDPADTDITFARRTQTLIAEFAGDFSTCEVDEDGAIVITDECLDPESLQLILDTMTANSFNFIAPDLVADEHIVTVEAKLSYRTLNEGTTIVIEEEDVEGGVGASAAAAYLGNGSVTIETVRMIKDEDVVVDLD